MWTYFTQEELTYNLKKGFILIHQESILRIMIQTMPTYYKNIEKPSCIDFIIYKKASLVFRTRVRLIQKKAYMSWEPSQTSTMELFAKIVNGFRVVVDSFSVKSSTPT